MKSHDYPLVPDDYLTSKDILELLSNPKIHNSCRCEPIRKREIAENVLKSMENNAEKLARSAQQKRGPPIRQSICVQTSVKKKNKGQIKKCYIWQFIRLKDNFNGKFFVW